jgi:hypothetical protein
MVVACALQGAVRSVAPFFPGLPPSHFGATPEQRFYIQLTLGFFIADSCFVRGGLSHVLVYGGGQCVVRQWPRTRPHTRTRDLPSAVPCLWLPPRAHPLFPPPPPPQTPYSWQRTGRRGAQS